MLHRSGDRGCFAVRALGEDRRRRRRVNAPVDEVQADLLTVARTWARTNMGLLLPSAIVVDRDLRKTKDHAAQCLSAGKPALARAGIIALH